uniref:Uncharacterized protein n=1 Tax=Timema poppense TaxID=170557 RepID=A0A7R9DIL3_TIMPO|nr:unnamed protein product [Timema poppensis]
MKRTGRVNFILLELAIMKGRGKPVKKAEESTAPSGPGDKDLAEQYRTLERDYEADEEKLHRLERDVRVLHDQTAKQVEFSYKMSSVLGDYLKEATKDAGTINAMVNDPGLKQFLEMMYRVFYNLHERGMTKNSEEDGRFIQSLVFIILNISQLPQGQEFILSEKFTEVLAILRRLLDPEPDKDVKGQGHECTFGEHLQVLLVMRLTLLKLVTIWDYLPRAIQLHNQTKCTIINTGQRLPKLEWNEPVSHFKLAHSILKSAVSCQSAPKKPRGYCSYPHPVSSFEVTTKYLLEEGRSGLRQVCSHDLVEDKGSYPYYRVQDLQGYDTRI